MQISRKFTPFAMVLSAVLALQLPTAVAQIRLTEDGIPTADDILQAEELVSECLGTQLSADSNQTSLSGNRLGVAFHPHDIQPGLERFYVAILNREDNAEKWKIQTLRLHAAQYLDTGSGVHVTGLLDPAITETLYNSVAEIWMSALGPDFTITAMNTTDMPETYCDYAGKRDFERDWYEVLVAGQKLPDGPVLPKYLYAIGLVEMGGTLERARAGEYKFNFKEDANGSPTFVSVECATVPAYICDEKLDSLQAALGTDQDEDTTQRDAAIMAVLPAPYTRDHIGEIQRSSGNGQESFVANLADVPASAKRTVRGIAICRRPLGSRADWGCEYRFINYNQTLSNGMMVSVRSLDLEETQVESIVAAVESDVANARIINISSKDGIYILNAMGPGFPGVTAYFDTDLNLTETQFRENKTPF